MIKHLDPLDKFSNDDSNKKEYKRSWISLVLNSQCYIFVHHIFKYGIRYGLKYFIFGITWLLETYPNKIYQNIPIYCLYVIAFVLVFINEKHEWVFKICFWIYNVAILSLFIFGFVNRFNDDIKVTFWDMNTFAAILLSYTFSYLHKNLRKVDISLSKLLFKTSLHKQSKIKKLIEKNEICLKDILEFDEDNKNNGEIKNINRSTYKNSNWTTFLIFLCPILIIQITVYYCLLMFSISPVIFYIDIIYFISLLTVIILLNIENATNINKLFNKIFAFILILFFIEIFYIIYGKITNDEVLGKYTENFRYKAKFVFLVLSLKVSFSFIRINS